MRKTYRRLLALCCLICLLAPGAALAKTPYNTYTVNGYGEMQETQTAYIVTRVITGFTGDEEVEFSEAKKDLKGLFVGEDGRIYNTAYVFDRAGRQIARHRKVHLYDADVLGMHVRESASFRPGNDITVFDTEYGKMGAAICFDLRFPELFRAMAVRGAQVVFLPAQFNMKTGPAHWDISLRSRAVDNEYFMVAAAAARYEGFNYECWGHSMVIDPFGQVLASCEAEETTVFAEIELQRVDEVRAQLPTFLKLRREIYTVAE